MQANYTFSKALADGGEGQITRALSMRLTLRNLALDKHRASFDQTHRFIANFIYELPFGPGRRGSAADSRRSARRSKVFK